ncbi:MAG: rhomboid family intramembrane serine protease [Planctomycetota bacterium]|nr:rhomboid family intramembrane serine protease [Planctomycetota bacterium]
MGIYDRDYYREPQRGGFASVRPWSVTTCLLVINIAIFIIDRMLQQSYPDDFSYGNFPKTLASPIYEWGYFSLTMAVQHAQIWRFITYQFLHASLGHLFFNMLGLFMFGPLVEGQLGSRRYLGFYLACGMAGPLMYGLLWVTKVMPLDASVHMIGASACIFGVLMAAAKVVPDMTITLLFPPIPITLKVLAYLYVAVSVFSLFRMGENAGAEPAHLGGALLGYLLIRNDHWLNFLVPARKAGASRRRRNAFRDWTRDPNH